MAERYRGVVVGILSGDSMIVRFLTKGITPVQNVCLEHVIAPKFGKNDGSTGDEPHAYESWDFLRNLCIGQKVLVMPPANKTEYTRSHPSFRDKMPVFFSRVFLCSRGEEDVGLICVEEGWVKIRAPKVRDSYVSSLFAGEANAKRKNIGIWRPNGFVRHLPVDYDPQELLDISEFDAIVENVMNGTTLALFLLPNHELIKFQIAGCRSASAKRDGGDEYGLDAKEFTVRSLLHRRVRVRLSSVNEGGWFFGPILDRSDRHIRRLISDGLAAFNSKTEDLTPAAFEYARCECEAKAERKGMWSKEEVYVSPIKSFEGDVRRILGTSSLEIDVRGEIRVVQFNNIRIPPYVPGGGSEPFSFEARERLRKLVIGETVTVIVDSAVPERYFGTVYFGSVCLNELLVREGFAKVIAPFCGVPSERKAELEQAEKLAEQEKIGVHGKEIPPLLVDDYSVNTYQDVAIEQMGHLTDVTLHGVVEDIRGGNRFVVLVPDHKIMLRIAVNGLLPLSPNDALGQEAISFCTENYLNRDIEFTLIEVDRYGGFIANMTMIDKHGQRKDIASALLAQGLAEIHHRTAATMSNFEELKAIQERASRDGVGKWAEKSRSLFYMEYNVSYPVRITHVWSSVEYVVQFLSDSLRQIDEQMSVVTSPITGTCMKNDVVAVNYNNAKYRGRVERFDAPERVRVKLIDFDVTVDVSADCLYELPAPVQDIPPQATTVNLAFLNLVQEEVDDNEWIMQEFRKYALYARVAYFKGERPYVVLFDSPNTKGGTLNAVILSNANVRVGDLDMETDAVFQPVIDTLVKISETGESVT